MASLWQNEREERSANKDMEEEGGKKWGKLKRKSVRLEKENVVGCDKKNKR